MIILSKACVIIHSMFITIVHSDRMYDYGDEDIKGELYENYLDGLIVVEENDGGDEESCAGESADVHNDEVVVGSESFLESTMLQEFIMTSRTGF